jgi:hypothetical protein
MSKPVPYLSDEAIESDAAALLADYAQARGVAVKPPIPIEDIVEKHLKLDIEFDDTHRLFGVPRSGLGLEPDILGAMFFDDARIVIDESLDPEETPAMEGRYCFTLAWKTIEASTRISGTPRIGFSRRCGSRKDFLAARSCWSMWRRRRCAPARCSCH